MTDEEKQQLIALYESNIVKLRKGIAQIMSSTSIDGRSVNLLSVQQLQDRINYFKRQIAILETGSDPKATIKTITFGL